LKGNENRETSEAARKETSILLLPNGRLPLATAAAAAVAVECLAVDAMWQRRQMTGLKSTVVIKRNKMPLFGQTQHCLRPIYRAAAGQ